MSELAIIEVFARGGAVAALMLCAAVFAGHRAAGRKDAAVAALCLSLAAYVIVSSPSLTIGTAWLSAGLVGIAGAVPVLLYWAALALFQDEVTLHPWQGGLMGAVLLSAWLSQAGFPLGVLRGICVLCLFGHLIVIVITGRAGDLVEARRQFRHWFVLAISLLAAVITLFEITGADQALPVSVFLLHAFAFWLLPGLFLLWAVRVDQTVWIATSSPSTRGGTPRPVQDPLISQISAAMAEGLWQQEGLTVAQLAQHLHTPEHRLRKTINQHLGHRNFASFINGYRIAAAQSLLRDPEQAERTILSIAYDVGFSSLGPFNRAFRAQTGTSPSAYRKAVRLEPMHRSFLNP